MSACLAAFRALPVCRQLSIAPGMFWTRLLQSRDDREARIAVRRGMRVPACARLIASQGLKSQSGVGSDGFTKPE